MNNGRLRPACCYQYFKDKNQRANHNYDWLGEHYRVAVINTSKIRIREQITTVFM